MIEPIFTLDKIHEIYLKWMNEQDNHSFRKDRFISLLKDVPIDKQSQIEHLLVAALAIGLEYGYNTKERNEI